MDSRTGRDSCPIEELGHYDPMCKDAETQTVLNVSRVQVLALGRCAAVAQGAVLLNKKGVKKPAPGEPWQVAETPAAAGRGHRQDTAAGRYLTGNGRRVSCPQSPPHRIDVLTLFPRDL